MLSNWYNFLFVTVLSFVKSIHSLIFRLVLSLPLWGGTNLLALLSFLLLPFLTSDLIQSLMVQVTELGANMWNGVVSSSVSI